MQHLIKALEQLTPLEEAAILSLKEQVFFQSFKKGHILQQENTVCRYLYFIQSGFARGSYSQKGKTITSWFAAENDFLISLHSFISQRNSFETIELLEDSELFGLSYEKLQGLYKQFPSFNRVGRLVIEKYYIALEEHTYSLQFETATERYRSLLNKEPGILKRASLGHIASYLGISQETLSRIRARR